jgi:hypothetical protein
VQPSTPGPPWFAFTFLNASTTACAATCPSPGWRT